MRLRQVALVGADLDQAMADIEAVLGLGASYPDPGVGKYGLGNAVWPIGDTFLEVVSPREPGTTAGRLLEKRRGDGGYMAIFQTEDLAGARARVAGAGVRVVDQTDRPKASFTHLHPKDTGGAIVSIDAMEPAEHWEWGGPDWRANVRTEVSTGIVGAELQGGDPAGMARRWAQVLGRPAEPGEGGGWWIGLVDGGELRFVPLGDDRGEGLVAFDVAVRDPAAVKAAAAARGCLDADGHVVLCGARVNLKVA